MEGVDGSESSAATHSLGWKMCIRADFGAVPPFPSQPQALTLHSPGLAVFSCKGQSLEELQPSIRAPCAIPAVQRDSGLREMCCWSWSFLPSTQLQQILTAKEQIPKILEMLTNPSLTHHKGQHWEQDCGGTQ